jgi:hypothetical protein
MAEEMQARCPGCNGLLRIPAEHVNAKLRCKRCGTRLHVRPRATTTKAVEPATVPSPPPAPTAPKELQPEEPELAFSKIDTRFSKITERYRAKRRTRWKPTATAAMALAALAIGLLCLHGVRSHLADTSWLKSDLSTSLTVRTKVAPVPSPAPPPTPFPRRMLAICVSNYLYAAPVNVGWRISDVASSGPREGARFDHSVHGVFLRLTDALHVPEDQRTELSDTAPGKAAFPPLKRVIENTIRDFLASSRAQDRILILFVGHAVEVDNQAYLVPIDGDLGDKKTLIPMAWVYEQLSKCKARQRALIVDVCRLDPAHPQEQPGDGPMGVKLDLALKQPPAGVQVWSACVAGQHSYEGFLPLADDAGSGGLFLNELYEAVGPYEKKHIRLGSPVPDGPLPLETLAEGDGKTTGVNKTTQTEVEELYHQKQTPRLTGQEPAGGAPHQPGEQPAARVVLHLPSSLTGGFADKDLIAGILEDVDRIPPLRRSQERLQRLMPETLPFLSAKVMNSYKDDGKSTPFREAIRKTTKLLQDEQIAGTFIEEFRAKANDAAIKERVLAQQRKPAIIQSDLEEALLDLKKAGEERDREPSRRWQATYDYVLALLQGRIAYVYEYNYMLGQIRKDALPPRDPSRHSGWRLTSREKLQSGAEAKKMAAASRKLLDKVIKEHPGTPYEVLAKREKSNPLGLDWTPTR